MLRGEGISTALPHKNERRAPPRHSPYAPPPSLAVAAVHQAWLAASFNIFSTWNQKTKGSTKSHKIMEI